MKLSQEEKDVLRMAWRIQAREYRRRKRDKYNLYMREYMRKRNKRKQKEKTDEK